jgi:acetyl esterase
MPEPRASHEFLSPRELTSPRDQPSARERLEGRLARLLAQLPGAWLLRLIGEQPTIIDGLTLDPHIQFILAARRRMPQPLMCEPTPAIARARNRREIAAAATSAGARPTRVRAVNAITVDGAGGPLPARHYIPIDADDREAPPLLVYFHGGGFVICDLDTHDEACRILCFESGMQVLSVAYRLAPEFPFPAPLSDCCAALRWSQENAVALGADPTRICVGGDSAGGNLATVAALTLAREGRPPAAQLLIYPTTDARATHPSRTLFASGFMLTAADIDAFLTEYLSADTTHRDDTLRDNPRVSPIRAEDLRLSPPALIVTAGFDPLRDEGEVYASALRSAGVPVQVRREAGLVHGFLHMTTVVPAARAAVVAMGRRFADFSQSGSGDSGY